MMSAEVRDAALACLELHLCSVHNLCVEMV